MGSDVVKKVEKKEFVGVNDNINKISNAEDEFKSVPGLVEKSVFNNVITHIDNKIKKEIVDKAMKKMNTKEVKGLVNDIVELKEWVNNLPVL